LCPGSPRLPRLTDGPFRRLFPVVCPVFPQVQWFQWFSLKTASKRAKKRLLEDTTEFMAGWIYPNFLLVIVVCLTYAVITPFIMVAGTS